MPWAPDTYVLAGSLGFVNSDLTLHVWGPTTLDAALEHAKDFGHKLAPVTQTALTAYACSTCQLTLSDIVAPHFLGLVLEQPCVRRHPR